MKTLFVTDLDGTLLNTEDCISEFSRKVINGLVEQGMLFTYATARSLVSASVVTKGLSANIPVIAYNGALVIHPATENVISSYTFLPQERERVIKLLNVCNIDPLVYSYIGGKEKVTWLAGKENEGAKRYLSLRQGDKRLNPVKGVENVYFGDIFYFTCIGEKEELLPAYNVLKDDENYTCTIQQELYRPEFWLEIMPKKATKANAVLTLKKLWNCDRVISFGDAINDIPMFRIADECYAVQNAVQDLKDLATGIIESNNEDGVAKYLLKHYYSS